MLTVADLDGHWEMSFTFVTVWHKIYFRKWTLKFRKESKMTAIITI